jgi:basic membrane protein A
VGAVVGPGGVDDPYHVVVSRGLRRAVSELGIVGRVFVAGPKENGSATYSYLARQGYDLLVGDASTITGLEATARRFPRTCFLSIDGGVESLAFRPANVAGTVYRVEQAAYLAGYLAALVEQRRPGRHVVSSVGGVPAPPVDRFIAGFRAGARRADPRVELLNGYSQDFLVPAKCRAVALRQIAKGSGVVFQVAGACGLGALQAAGEKHVFGIGVDSDQSSLGPHVLTSVLKNVDVALFRAVRSLQAGTFRPGANTFLSLKDGGVGLGRISPRVPGTLIEQTVRVRQQLVSGRLTAPSTLR